ncbi:MAG: putative bifunctional diguanylate cyclase/phosphodiesterase [Burkholderiales bacterium]
MIRLGRLGNCILLSGLLLVGLLWTVVVGVVPGEALAAFDLRRREYYAGAALISLLILLAAAVLIELTTRQRRLTHQMRLIADNVPAAIAYFDAELRCRYANAGFGELNDAAPESMPGRTLAEITGEEVYGQISQTLPQLRRGETEKYRRAHRGKSGAPRTIEVYRVPDMSPAGKFQGMYVMTLDVTEQVEAEAHVEASEAKARTAQKRLQDLLSSLREVVYSRRPDNSEILYVSPPVERLYGFAAEAFVADPALWSRMIHPEDREWVESSNALLLRQGTREIEYRIVRTDGEIRTVNSVAQLVRDENGRALRIDGVLTDVTARRLAEERSRHLAQHDLLTGLPNRDLFRDRLAVACRRASRRGETLGVMLINLDRFKQVNESLGDDAGDALLRQVASRLRGCLREEDTVGRLGGDEFAVLLESVSGTGDVATVAEKVSQSLGNPFGVNGNEVFIPPSIGVAVYREAGDDARSLLSHAEIAMRRVKQDGGNGCQSYVPDTGEKHGQRIALESRLRRALGNGEFTLHYQPKVSLRSGAVMGVEALLRWNNPELGAISPGQFIPIAEETGLIVPIGEWVLRTACAQAVAWEREGLALTMAVNLSPRQFRQTNLAGVVAAILAQTGLRAGWLEVEITESTAMTNPRQAVAAMRELRRLGVQLAVDDFGTGYSSLNYLKRFPLHRLKIDRSFVKDIGADSHDEAIIAATVALARSMKLKITAEGVENEVQLDFLARAGCDDYQGFHFSRPLPAQELRALLANTPTSEP